MTYTASFMITKLGKCVNASHPNLKHMTFFARAHDQAKDDGTRMLCVAGADAAWRQQPIEIIDAYRIRVGGQRAAILSKPARCRVLREETQASCIKSALASLPSGVRRILAVKRDGAWSVSWVPARENRHAWFV